MAPLFCAYDCTTYQRLIPHHLAAFLTKIVECFEKGGFTVNISGGNEHYIALDEARETLINKEMKGAVVRSTQAYLQKTSLFLRHRIALHKALLKQVFVTSENLGSQKTSTTQVRKREENTIPMTTAIEESNLLPVDIQRVLLTCFLAKKQILRNRMIF